MNVASHYLLISLLICLYWSCDIEHENAMRIDAKTMYQAKKAIYTKQHYRPIKHPFFKPQRLYTEIQLVEGKDFNYFLVYNNTEDTISYPSQDGQIVYIQEALDEEGQWKSIEYWVNSTCGNSYFNSMLNANTYTWFLINKYKGDYKTKLRVKYKLQKGYKYSPEFEGYINTEQFNQPNSLRDDQLLK